MCMCISVCMCLCARECWEVYVCKNLLVCLCSFVGENTRQCVSVCVKSPKPAKDAVCIRERNVCVNVCACVCAKGACICVRVVREPKGTNSKLFFICLSLFANVYLCQ